MIYGTCVLDNEYAMVVNSNLTWWWCDTLLDCLIYCRKEINLE